MIDFDSHIHTRYCGHADTMTIEAIARRADELNLKSLLIAEHIFGPEDIHYLDKIRKQLSRYNSSCKILIGVEVDIDPSKTDGCLVVSDDLLKKADLVIGAAHYIPTVGNYPHSPADNALEPEDFLQKWHNSITGMLRNCSIDIFAHPGRIAACSLDMDIYFDDVIAVLSQAAKISAERGIYWEINELTCDRIGDSASRRWHKTTQIALDAGVKITAGSDAHRPEDIAKQNNIQQIITALDNFDSLDSPEDIFNAKPVK